MSSMQVGSGHSYQQNRHRRQNQQPAKSAASSAPTRPVLLPVLKRYHPERRRSGREGPYVSGQRRCRRRERLRRDFGTCISCCLARDYWQVSEAVPLTVVDVFCTPLFTVKLRFSGALAVMVTVPGAEQVTSPVEPIVAATAPVLVGDVFHVRPSTC